MITHYFHKLVVMIHAILHAVLELHAGQASQAYSLDLFHMPLNSKQVPKLSAELDL